MKKLLVLCVVLALLSAPAATLAQGGFDQYGYNYEARMFVGPADGIDRILDGKVFGVASNARDHVVMNWNAEWDRGQNESWSNPPYYDAWMTQNWNGQVPGGSGERWILKNIWVGQCGPEWTPLPDGGYCNHSQFEYIYFRGTVADDNLWLVHALPAGLMAPRQ